MNAIFSSLRGMARRARAKSSLPDGFVRTLKRSDWYKEIALAAEAAGRIEVELSRRGIDVRSYAIDVSDFCAWEKRCGWTVPWQPADSLPSDLAEIQATLRAEKLLEYYLSLRLAPIGPGSRVADFGSANSRFLQFAVHDCGAEGWAVDPALAGRPPVSEHGVRLLPLSVSQAGESLPALDLIAMHCSFEMFSPAEMTAVLQAAARKLCRGGKLIVLPLYLAAERTIYADASLPLHAPAETGIRVGVHDYWQVPWSEWHSPATLHERLLRPFPELSAVVYRVTNAHEVDAACYMRFIGVWERMQR